jgi:hypothetical protein
MGSSDNNIDEEAYEAGADNAALESRSHELARPDAPAFPVETPDDLDTESNEPPPTTDLPPNPAYNTISGSFLKPHVVSYGNSAGEPISVQTSAQERYSARVPNENNIYAPFSGKLEWEVARWAKFQNHLSASAVTELLAIEGVCGLLFFDWNCSDKFEPLGRRKAWTFLQEQSRAQQNH